MYKLPNIPTHFLNRYLLKKTRKRFINVDHFLLGSQVKT